MEFLPKFKMMKKTSLALLFLFWSLSVFISGNSYAQKYYLFRNYTVKDGLIHNVIYSINQDSKGYLWISTGGGISRFDGAYFDNTLIPEVNNIQAFSQYIDKSPSGRLAFSTFMQGVITEQNNGTFKQHLRRKKQLGKNVVRTLKWVSEHKIITSESRNINVIENDSIYQLYDYGSDKNVFITIDCDHLGNIWFGGFLGAGIMSSANEPVFFPEFKDILIIKILFSDKNKLLVGTRSGYYEINITSAQKGNLQYNIEQPYPELVGKEINHIYCDRQNNIWISCVTDGVYQIENGEIKRHFTTENGLPSNSIMCAFQDNEGNYWFGTESGICRLYSLEDFSYTHNGHPLSGISIVAKDPFGRLWLSDGSMLYFLEKDKIHIADFSKKAFEKGIIKSIQFTSNDCNLFTDKALYSMPLRKRANPQELTKKIDFVKNNMNELRCFYYDSSKTLWMGCVDGPYLYFSDKVKKVKIISSDELTLRPNDIVKDKYGNFWLGDFIFGLYHFKPEIKGGDIILHHIQSYKSLKPDSAFATAWIQGMLIDQKHQLWMSSLYTGVYKLQLDQSGINKATLYSTKNGMSSNDVTQIIEGKDGTMWFGSSNGANRLVIDKDGKERIIHYNEKNGFGRLVYNILPDDSITYICYEDGFFAVSNKINSSQTDKPISVIISKISVMGKADTVAMSRFGEVYVLPHNLNSISFEFGSVKLKNNEGIDYQYRLKGVDESWSEYSMRRYAGYNSLPPGKYTFQVRAKMLNNDKDGSIAEYYFRIKPPFYRTWWFVVTLIVLIAVVVYVFYIQRIRGMIKMERLRIKIASDLHDDIGSTLSSISIMSEIIQSQIDKSTQSGELIREIGSNAHLMLENMDDIIWVVKPFNDKFHNFEVRIREYAIPLFESKNIQFQLVVPEELDSLPLSMEMRRNLFLIAKESVNNLVKYSQCNQADILFSYSHSILKMVIADNGIGFDITQTSHQNNGLRNMRQRAKQIGGNIEILSGNGGGTKIILSVKII